MRVPRLLLFGQAREAAGTAHDEVEGGNVAEVVSAACSRYGVRFSEVAAICRVWVNGEPASPGRALCDGDEVAMLPPVSGG
jgi:molybdopterin converting factor small subunit